ncbi:MAG: PAS domain S-box protein [Gammaproteobacteria bacterium]
MSGRPNEPTQPAGMERAGELEHRVLDLTDSLFMQLDAYGRIQRFNAACERLSGYRFEDVRGRPLWDALVPDAQRALVRDTFVRLCDRPDVTQHDIAMQTREGRLIWVQWRSAGLADSNGRVERLVCVGLDITARHRLEESLRSNARQLHQLTDNLPVLIAHVDRDMRYLFVNRAYEEWFDVPRNDILGRTVAELVGPAAWSVIEANYQRALAGERVFFDALVPYQHAGARPIMGTYLPDLDDEGDVQGIFVLITDLTNRERMQADLDEANIRAQAMLDTAVDAIITIDAAGTIETFNQSAEKIFGYRAAEVIGENVKVLMPSPYREAHDDYLRRYVESGERHIIGIGREVTARRRDGTLFPADLAVGEIRLPGRQLFTGFIRDISDRKSAEQEAHRRLGELAHVSRIASLGEMASGLAHEVNQPLAAVVSYARACLRMLKQGTVDPAMLEDALSQIALQGERAGDIIRHLRQLVHKTEPRREPVALPTLIDEVLWLVNHELISNGIEVVRKDARRLPPAQADRIQVEQVLLNLVRNAIDVLRDGNAEGRRIVINTALSETDDGPTLRVGVQDNGPGISPEVRDSLFDGFVTTKPDGLGQGLAISRTIIRSHGGELWADEAEKGAHFCFTLPVEARDG